MAQKGQESWAESLEQTDPAQCQVPQSMDCHYQPGRLQQLLQMVSQSEVLLLHRWTNIPGQDDLISSPPEAG